MVAVGTNPKSLMVASTLAKAEKDHKEKIELTFECVAEMSNRTKLDYDWK